MASAHGWASIPPVAEANSSMGDGELNVPGLRPLYLIRLRT
jgi:hypothetical protein